MNRAYRLIWNAAKDVWVVAAEKVKGKGRCPAGAVGTPSLSIGSRRNSDNYPGGDNPEPKLSSLRASDRRMPFSSLMMALEPRFMFDAAAAATVGTLVDRHHDDVPVPVVDRSVAESHAVTFDFASTISKSLVKPVVEAPVTSVPGVEIAFIDARVQDIQTLLAGIKPGVQVVMLDPTKDGITQITQALQQAGKVSAIHIISHGSSGDLQLGSTELTNDTLVTHTTDISAWRASLAPGADILIYGCDVAQGSAGAAFVSSLARITSTDVAASTDRTGAAAQGGDWILEYTSGVIETKNLSVLDYQDVLAAGVATNVSGITFLTTPAVPANGYAAGEVVRVQVAFTGTETVTGTPTLTLNVGGNLRTANYVSGSGSVNLVFAYTVVAGDPIPTVFPLLPTV